MSRRPKNWAFKVTPKAVRPRRGFFEDSLLHDAERCRNMAAARGPNRVVPETDNEHIPRPRKRARNFVSNLGNEMTPALRTIAIGLKRLDPPTDGRTGYLPREYALALGVDYSTVYRWIQRSLIQTETYAGFKVIPLEEALRFSRHGPRP
jgi:hypothetical protein